MRVLVVLVLMFGPPFRAWGAVHMHRHPTPVGETGGSKAQGRGTGRGITRPAQGAQRRGRLGTPGPAAQLYPCAREGEPLRKGPSRKETAHGVLVTRCDPNLPFKADGVQLGPRIANGVVTGRTNYLFPSVSA